MKRNLLKAIGISFLIFVVLSWIIPVGTYADGKLTTSGISPVGLIDLFSTPLTAMTTFALYGVVFIVIGGLYGVMEKTGALVKFENAVLKMFKGKEKLFLILTTLQFVILSSVTGLMITLFVLVPLYAAILSKMGYRNITALAATIGAMLIGSIGSTVGFNISGYTINLLSLSMTDQLLGKVILLVVLTIALLIFVIKTAKKVEVVKPAVKAAKVATKTVKKPATKTTTKKTTTKKPAAKKTTAKKTTKKKTTANLAVTKKVKKVVDRDKVSAVPLIVIFSIMIVVALVGMYNWYYAFGINVFNDFYDSVMGVKVKGIAIFSYLFGSGASQIGYWGNAEFAALMLFTALLIGWIYRLSFHQIIESFIAGVKKWMPTALYAVLASIVLGILYQAAYYGNGTMVDTIMDKIFGLSDGFNVIVTGVASLVGSFFYNDLYYLLSTTSAFVTGFDANSLPIAGIVLQAGYALGMLIFPTSVILIAGLSYFDVSYKQWFKYIWKFALIAFIIVLLLCSLLTLF